VSWESRQHPTRRTVGLQRAFLLLQLGDVRVAAHTSGRAQMRGPAGDRDPRKCSAHIRAEHAKHIILGLPRGSTHVSTHRTVFRRQGCSPGRQGFLPALLTPKSSSKGSLDPALPTLGSRHKQHHSFMHLPDADRRLSASPGDWIHTLQISSRFLEHLGHCGNGCCVALFRKQ
jgi:hypothetical protein